MEEFLKFLSNNYQVILSTLFLLISMIIGFCVSKSGKCKALLSLFEKLPAFIKDAESKGFTSGSAKFKYVFELSVIYLASLLNKSVEAVSKKYCITIENSIEQILSTPQKKEVKLDEKEIK